MCAFPVTATDTTVGAGAAAGADIAGGIVTGVVGPNGAGKSTLLSVLGSRQMEEVNYLYFENKEALFREVVRETAIAAIERGEQAPATGTPSEQITVVMQRYWEFVRSPAFATIHRLVIGELHQFPDLAKFYAEEVIARGMRLLTGILRRGIETGEFRDMDPAAAARMLVALFVMNGVWCDKRDCLPVLEGRPDDQVLTDIVEFYLNGIRPVGAASAQADGA